MMDAVTPTLTLARAIGVLFARRYLRPILIIGIIAAVILHAIGGWLAYEDPWWWIAEGLLIFLTLIFVALIVVVLVVLRVIEPAQTSEQKQAVAAFVDKLGRVTEGFTTPMPLIIFYVVRDTIFTRNHNYIEDVSRDSQALAPDFIKLHKLFTLRLDHHNEHSE